MGKLLALMSSSRLAFLSKKRVGNSKYFNWQVVAREKKTANRSIVAHFTRMPISPADGLLSFHLYLTKTDVNICGKFFYQRVYKLGLHKHFNIYIYMF